MEVLCGRVLSCCNLCLTIWIDCFTGTEVKRALTSYEVMVPCFQLFALQLLNEVLGVFKMVGDLPTNGLMMCESSLATP